MKILITGATGFVGYRLVQHLQAAGHQIFATGRNLSMGEKISYLKVPFLPGAIEDADFVDGLVRGMDAVVHTAGLASPWGREADFYASNVQGTEHVVQSCLRHEVPRLVHFSTPSLYVTGQDRLDVREEDPLPPAFINAYAATKHQAEIKVMAGAAKGLETILLRPRAIIGAGDTVIVPRLLRAHQEGRLRIIGNGRNHVDLTAVANVCQAVERALVVKGEALGKAYNLSNGEPVLLWETLREAFEGLGLPLSRSRIPLAVAYALAAGMELAAQADPAHREPPLTRYSVLMLARSQTLNISRARHLLGYVPQQSTAEAMVEFTQWWKQQHWAR